MKKASANKKVCNFFNQNKCRNGSSCPFFHPHKSCKDWQTTEDCPRGDSCTFKHPTVPCRFAQTGKCSKSDQDCGFQHTIQAQLEGLTLGKRQSYGSSAHSSSLNVASSSSPMLGVRSVSHSVRTEEVQHVLQRRKNFAFCASVDTSGSMSGSRIDQAIESLELINKEVMKDHDLFALFKFDTKVEKLHFFKPNKDLRWDRDAQNLRECGGRTALYSAIIEAIDTMRKAQQSGQLDRSTIVEHLVITDGQENSSSDRDRDMLEEYIRRPRISNYNLKVIHVGGDGLDGRLQSICGIVEHANFETAGDLSSFRRAIKTYSQIIIRRVVTTETKTVMGGKKAFR